jgi:cytochrome bd-type quinol oxidase subunit 2
MKRFAIALLCGIAGYVIVAVASYVLIDHFSSNVHDRAMEAAMTSAFVFGPLGAVVVFVVAFVRIGRGAPGDRSGA